MLGSEVRLFPATNELIWTVINLLMLVGIIWAVWRLIIWRNGPGRHAGGNPGASQVAAVERQCPKCQTPMVAALPHDPMKGKITAFKEPVKVVTPTAKSTLTVYVCPSCGFAEWYADQPEQFRS
jgi:hypothetical protein